MSLSTYLKYMPYVLLDYAKTHQCRGSNIAVCLADFFLRLVCMCASRLERAHKETCSKLKRRKPNMGSFSIFR